MTKAFGTQKPRPKSSSSAEQSLSSSSHRPSAPSTATATATASEIDSSSESQESSKVRPKSSCQRKKGQSSRSGQPNIGSLRSIRKPLHSWPSSEPASPQSGPAKNAASGVDQEHRPPIQGTDSPACNGNSNDDLDQGPPDGPSPARRRLGRLASNRPPARVTASASPGSNSDARASHTPQTPGRRLGRLGAARKQQGGLSSTGPSPQSTTQRPEGRNVDEDVEMQCKDNAGDSSATDSLSPSPSPSPSKPPPRQGDSKSRSACPSPKYIKPSAKEPGPEEQHAEETAEQQANRRRAELKRTLMASCRAKKKRRF